MTKAKATKRRAVMVCTDKRGIFFGYVTGDVPLGPVARVRLERARMCVYWTGVHGVMALASEGPGKQCRVTPAVPAIDLVGIHASIDCDLAAVTRWEAEPWG